MYVNNNKICAEVGNYLKHKHKSIVALTTIIDTIDDYEEVPLNTPLDIIVEDNYIFFNGRLFLFIPPKFDKENIKSYIIKTRYTPDDQIAILLNKEDSLENHQRYERMQDWRTFASDITNKVLENEKMDM